MRWRERRAGSIAAGGQFVIILELADDGKLFSSIWELTPRLPRRVRGWWISAN